MKLRNVFVCAAIVVPFFAVAQDAEDDLGWNGKATLGYLATSGNTENSNLNTGLEFGYNTENWTHLATMNAIYATEDDSTSAEAYKAGWKSEWDMTEKDFFFGELDWRKDRFGPYATQFSQSIGYGRRVFETEKHKLNLDIGVGARQSEDQLGMDENETILRGGLKYRWQISESAEFRQDLKVEGGEQNTYTESTTALSATLVGNMALVASYTIKNNSDVPPLTEKTDTYTSLSLEYVFK